MMYKGFRIEKIEGTQVGHTLPNSRQLSQQIGIGTSRKCKGYQIFYPEEFGGGSKILDTLREAKAYVDAFLD